MKEFEVTITETLQKSIMVEAATREEAQAMVEEMWDKERPSVIQKLRAINPLEQAVKKDKVRHKGKGLELCCLLYTSLRGSGKAVRDVSGSS